MRQESRPIVQVHSMILINGPDEGILTQVEDVDDVFEYLTATMPAIFIISVISIIIIVC